MNRSVGWALKLRWALVGLMVATLTGCANFYVDGQTKEVDASQYRKPAAAHAVQVLFEFQTKGVANAAATQNLKSLVLEKIRDSGVFTEVVETPVAGGALLSVTLNNVPLTDNAFSKGFVTGFTFGLVGSQVSDGYVCIAEYTPPGTTQAITKQARHAIHTTMGANSAPPNSVKADNVMQAVTLMTRQVVSTVLSDVTQDESFK